MLVHIRVCMGMNMYTDICVHMCMLLLHKRMCVCVYIYALCLCTSY